MAIVSALNDAGHLRLSEGVFCCAFASALDLQPLLALSWPDEHQPGSGVPATPTSNGHVSGHANQQLVPQHPGLSRLTFNLSSSPLSHSSATTNRLWWHAGPSGFHDPMHGMGMMSSGSGRRAGAGQVDIQPPPALQPPVHAVGRTPLSLTSEDSIRAAVSAATALDDPQATPEDLLGRLQVLQAKARHASQATRLNTCVLLLCPCAFV